MIHRSECRRDYIRNMRLRVRIPSVQQDWPLVQMDRTHVNVSSNPCQICARFSFKCETSDIPWKQSTNASGTTFNRSVSGSNPAGMRKHSVAQSGRANAVSQIPCRGLYNLSLRVLFFQTPKPQSSNAVVTTLLM